MGLAARYGQWVMGMISVEHFEPAHGRRTTSSPARHEQNWCLPTLVLNRSLRTLSTREMRMKRETDQYTYLVSLLRISVSIAPTPLPIFIEGHVLPSRVMPAAIHQQ